MIKLDVMAQVRGFLATSGDGGTARLDVLETALARLNDGTGIDQANAVYIDAFSIAASGSQLYDLAGTLTDRLGNPLVFTAIKTILVRADAANVNNVVYGNALNDLAGPVSPITATLPILPGGFMLLVNRSAAGWAVVAGTGDQLKLANSGAGSVVTGTIVVIGEV